MTDQRTVDNLTPAELDALSLDEWAAIAKRTVPASVVDLVVSSCKGEIPVADAVVGGQAIYQNRRDHEVTP